MLGRNGTFYGGAGRTIFRMTTNGVLTRIVLFPTDQGAASGLMLAGDGNLYGIANGTGKFQYGSMFQVRTNGVLTTLLTFTPASEGSSPTGELLWVEDGTIYRTTELGGSANEGTVFSVSASGVFRTLGVFRGPNGRRPTAGLVRGEDCKLYGTTLVGGGSDAGTVFRVTTNGSLTRLASLNVVNGFMPQSPMLLEPDGSFSGITSSGAADGIVFRVTPTGLLTKVASILFIGAPLTPGRDNDLYGTTLPNGFLGW